MDCLPISCLPVMVSSMKKNVQARIKEFYKMSIARRRSLLENQTGCAIQSVLEKGISIELADNMIENAIGTIGIPLGIATNFVINGNEVIVPMATEEPSVIAAASNAAKMAREPKGFVATANFPHTVAQIEILNPSDEAAGRIKLDRDEILKMANETQPELVSLGGGAREIHVRENVGDKRLVVHLVVDCKDAMGANIVNTMAEAVSRHIVKLATGQPGLRILTNLADERLAQASCQIPFNSLSRRGFDGHDVAKGIVAAFDFAVVDPYRAATHNKGIFNGIDAVLLATGNDWRAVEAGGHAWAARNGTYSPLATWKICEDMLEGQIELPMAVGIVGGASRTHPVADLCIKLLGVKTANELAQVVVSTGLATNLAALAALSSEGIQQGHMRLHKRRIEKE